MTENISQNHDTINEIDITQFKNAVATIKETSISHAEKNYGLAGGAALSAVFGMGEYFAARFVPPVGNQPVVNSNNADIVVDDPSTQDPNSTSQFEDPTHSDETILKNAEQNKDALKP